MRRQVETGTDRNAAAVRLVRAKLGGVMMPLTKSDAFEKGKPTNEKVKPTNLIFLNGYHVEHKGQWWRVPAKAYSNWWPSL